MGESCLRMQGQKQHRFHMKMDESLSSMSFGSVLLTMTKLGGMQETWLHCIGLLSQRRFHAAAHPRYVENAARQEIMNLPWGEIAADCSPRGGVILVVENGRQNSGPSWCSKPIVGGGEQRLQPKRTV